jgi:hypothetical protein
MCGLQIVEPARILINAADLDRRHRHRAFYQSKLMCGRFTLKTSRAKIAELIGSSKSLPLFKPRYNIAPSQPVLAVRIEPERASGGSSPPGPTRHRGSPIRINEAQ